MPCHRKKGGWQIKKKSGGYYPKVYKSKEACEKRVRQMHAHKKK